VLFAIFCSMITAWLKVRRDQRAVSAGDADRRGERILRFEGELRVQPDGAGIVTEFIRLRASGAVFREGLGRRLPPVLVDGWNVEHPMAYSFSSARRNGRPVKASLAGLSDDGMQEFLFGEMGAALPRGDHVFELQYRIPDRVFRTGGRNDVRWSVTGAWPAPIDQAVGLLKLPAGVDAAVVEYRAEISERAAASMDGRGAPIPLWRRQPRKAGEGRVLLEPDPNSPGGSRLQVRGWSETPLTAGRELIICASWPFSE